MTNDNSFNVLNFLAAFAIISAFTMARVSSTNLPTPAPAPGPGGSCETVIYNMMDCIDYITVGGKSDRPSDSCCAGIKSVLDFDGACICVAIKSSSQLGIRLNMTRVGALPSLCKLNPYPLEKCGLSGAPGPAPVEPPSPSPKPPVPAPHKPATPAPLPPESKNPAPAPAPGDQPPADGPRKGGSRSLMAPPFAALLGISLVMSYNMLA